MITPLSWIRGFDHPQGERRHKKRPRRRLRFEQCEARVVLDAQGLPAAEEIAVADFVDQASCPAPLPAEAELVASATAGSIADPQREVAYPLQDGKQIVFEGGHTARLLNEHQHEAVFTNVEVVRDRNVITLFPDGHMISTLALMLPPPGKVLLGERYETLEGEFLPQSQDVPVDAEPLEHLSQLERGTPVRLYRIWGIAERFDADGSRSVGVADLLAVLRSLEESRGEGRSATDSRSLATDVNTDGILSQADVLAMLQQLQRAIRPSSVFAAAEATGEGEADLYLSLPISPADHELSDNQAMPAK